MERKAFTLVELLVVIAIIALLMGIPNRRQTRDINSEDLSSTNIYVRMCARIARSTEIGTNTCS